MYGNRSCCSGFPLHSRLVFLARTSRLILFQVDIMAQLVDRLVKILDGYRTAQHDTHN